jgi:nicotinamidase-related amidase
MNRKKEASKKDLYGSAPDHSPVALLLVDVINDLQFEGSRQIIPYVLPMAKNIRKLKRRAKKANVPVIYVNDNFGIWRSDFKKIVRRCENSPAAKSLIQLLKPQPDDYFVLKPKHSGFYSTVLDVLLSHLGARKLILTGLAGNVCVLFTANEAFVRNYEIIVSADCVASNSQSENQRALKFMERYLKAKILKSSEIDFKEFLATTDPKKA